MGVASAAGTSASSLHFTTISHNASRWRATNVLPRIGSAWVGVVPTASGSSDPRWSRVDWNRYFAIDAAFAAPTSGYRITIRSISVQRISSGRRQFCVVAKIARPAAGTAVDPRPTMIEHGVKLSRRPFRNVGEFGWTFPPDVVLRGTDGKLLAAEVAFLKPGERAYRPAPALCHS